MKRTEQGFTVIELMAVIILLTAAAFLFFIQKNNVEVAARDEKRKIAVNAIYYNLEEVYYPKNKYYPEELSAQDLPAMDPSLLKDSNGFEINDEYGLSQYRYEPHDCTDGKCKGYELRTDLENEEDYVKRNRR